MKQMIVAKVGGSLFDWPELGSRLTQWLATFSPAQILLVPGGGAIVDVVRDLDRRHAMGEEAAHWLALHAMTLNAHFLASILDSLKAIVVSDFQQCRLTWARERLPVLDVFPFCRADDNHSDHLPHTWSTTSDSIAARVAIRLNATKLIILKSGEVPKGDEWMHPAAGFVDSVFASLFRQAKRTGSALEVSAINFRD
jgi:aspartokinase-like uncharacterized kinase